MSKVLVLGAGGFIGGHLSTKLTMQGHDVYGVDIKHHEYGMKCKEFNIVDLRNQLEVNEMILLSKPDTIYQLAADMGGAGFVFTGKNDAEIMHNSAMINLNILNAVSRLHKQVKIFYSSSACAYPEYNQMDPNNPNCEESSAYPANPDSEYGWEKLFSERLYSTYNRTKNIDIRIARFHNIFGPLGTWNGGREKAPAALCRKVAMANSGDEIEIWGDGNQTRTFLYIDECLEGIERLMASNFKNPINIGSDEMVSINQLAEMIIKISGKTLKIKHIDGPQGVRGRSSDNRLIMKELNWSPSMKLYDGLEKTYDWISSQVRMNMFS